MGWLQERLPVEALNDALGTEKRVVELAQQFRFSGDTIVKVATAALLHNCATCFSVDELRLHPDAEDPHMSDFDRMSALSLRSFAAASIARREFRVGDNETLNAIRYHATGRAGMGTVEKLVCVAHKMQQNRKNPLFLDKVMRFIHYGDPDTLDGALMYLFDSQISYDLGVNELIHPRSVEARNELLLSLKARLAEGQRRPNRVGQWSSV